MIVYRPEIKVQQIDATNISNNVNWKYRVIEIDGKPIHKQRKIYISDKGILGYVSPDYKIVPYKIHTNIVNLSVRDVTYKIFINELLFSSQNNIFYHSSKKLPDKTLEIEVGKEFITENNAHVKIIAFEPISAYAQEDQWIGLLTRPGFSKIDGAIRFNLIGQVLSHGRDFNYNLREEKQKTHIIKTLFWVDKEEPISVSYNKNQFDLLSKTIANLEKQNIPYKVITNEVEF